MAFSRPSKPFRLLYAGYIISCIGDRLWTFAIIFILQKLGGMRLVGINQLIESVSAMLLASCVGNWLDRKDRRHGTLTVLMVNNISVALSAALLAVCLTLQESSFLYIACLTLSIIFCALSKCASEGEKMAFTKDWIVVMARVEGGNTLSSRNATMTTIDQLSSVIAPILTGYILQFTGHRTACFVFVGWNFASWLVERQLLISVYNRVCELAVRQRTGDEDFVVQDEIDSLTKEKAGCVPFTGISRLFRAYFRQSVFPAAFGLALLYMTVLGFDGLAISHGKAQGVPENVLGVFRSVGSALGIAGAFSYTFAEQRIGVRRTGMLGLVLQQVFLYLCVASVFLPGSPFDPIGYASDWTFEGWLAQFRSSLFNEPAIEAGIDAGNATLLSVAGTPADAWSPFKREHASILAFFCGITFARLGLWMADLSIVQIMQEAIPEAERNTVFGVQASLSDFFSVLKDVVVIVMPEERTFGFLIFMSVAFVGMGFLHYCYYMLKTRRATRVSEEHPTTPSGTELKSLSASQGLLANEA